jgi:two-component SAPR family response regulator
LTDVVLADGPDGIELARQFRAVRPDVPVLFMSGYTADHYGELEPGQLLPKPFTEATLTAMVRSKIDLV